LEWAQELSTRLLGQLLHLGVGELDVHEALHALHDAADGGEHAFEIPLGVGLLLRVDQEERLAAVLGQQVGALGEHRLVALDEDDLGVRAVDPGLDPGRLGLAALGLGRGVGAVVDPGGGRGRGEREERQGGEAGGGGSAESHGVDTMPHGRRGGKEAGEAPAAGHSTQSRGRRNSV
jgi:hypothetical protein